ncbi:carbon monoxide dehydrogenase subunit G [Nonomuraea sp. NEAU-A123]|uniref:SRPBCC family protein n=1 Tax=Nonomuraea sp. NEAU-A123 TaxID=2839649 RepID=UPI0027DF72E8|nr:carbon monoxide dehydrogenase subunit G [Nonomuraea sp. NEAU-A123]
MKVAGSAMIGVERHRVWDALQDPAVLVRTIPGCERLEETGPDTYRMTVTAGVASIKGVYQGEVSLAEPSEPESFVLRARGQGAPGTVEATVLVRLSEVDEGTRVDYDADAVIGGMIGGVGQRMLGSVAKRTAGEFFAAVEDHLRAPEDGYAVRGGVPAAGEAGQGAATDRGVGQGAAVRSGAGQGAVVRSGAGQGAVVEGEAERGMGVDELAARRAAVARAAGEAAGAEGRRAPAVYERPSAVYERPPRSHTETRPWVMLASFGMGAGIALTGVAVGWLLGRAGRRPRP